MSETSVKTEVARWIRDAIADRQEVSLPELADAAMAHFKQQPKFAERWAAETFRPFAYEFTQKVCGQTRRLVHHGDTYIERQTLREKLEAVRSTNWLHWMEWTGVGHKCLADMVAADLQAAAELRRRSGDAEHFRADVWDAIRTALPTGKRVGDVLTNAQIEALADRVRASGGAPEKGAAD